MSSYLNLLPEYKDKNGTWQPVYANGKSDMFFQCNMRDCLRDFNVRIYENDLTEEELKFFKGTYTSRVPKREDDGFTVVKDSNGSIVYEDKEETFDYTNYARVVTLSELFDEADKEKAFFKETVLEYLGDYESAIKTGELAKILVIKGDADDIPSNIRETIFDAKRDLVDYVTNDEYNSLDNYICLNHLAQILIGFGRAAGTHTDDLRFLYYVM